MAFDCHCYLGVLYLPSKLLLQNRKRNNRALEVICGVPFSYFGDYDVYYHGTACILPVHAVAVGSTLLYN